MYPERKRHKKAIKFYQNFKNLELRISGKVLLEVGEILNESFSALVLRIRESIKHIERTGKNWDELKIPQRRKLLIEFEDNINNDKELMKKNRMEFVLNGFRRLENILVNYTFDEIQDALLSFPGDLSGDVLSKAEGLFVRVYLDEEKVDGKQIEYSQKIDQNVASKYFNHLSSSKDKGIVVELLSYLGFGAEGIAFNDIIFYTEDPGFRTNYLNLKAAKTDYEKFCSKEIAEFLVKTCSALNVEIAY